MVLDWKPECAGQRHRTWWKKKQLIHELENCRIRVETEYAIVLGLVKCQKLGIALRPGGLECSALGVSHKWTYKLTIITLAMLHNDWSKFDTIHIARLCEKSSFERVAAGDELRRIHH